MTGPNIRHTQFSVGAYMTREVVTLRPEDDLALASVVFSFKHLRHLPVVEDGRLVGLVTHRDLLRSLTNVDARTVRADEVMTRELTTVGPDVPLRTAARQMLRHKYGCLPVVEGGRLVGIITESDLVRFAAHVLADLDRLDALMDHVAAGERSP